MQLPANTDVQSSVPAFRIVGNELGQVRKLINEQLQRCPEEPSVARLVEHLKNSGGKMIRPGLVLLTGGASGKITDKHIYIAAIMEMIHNATLLHDDVIDEGKSRRGQVTVNSLWGNESAVLLGDFLLSKIFRMCADLEPHVTRIIAEATERTCEGELRQIAQRENWRLKETEYIDIITEKSAALFSSCCYLGGFLAGAGETELRLMSDFGLNLGIAFQIIDDSLDLVGDQNKTGKPSGNDLDRNKLTLPLIHLLGKTTAADKEVIKNILARGAIADTDNFLLKKLAACGSIGYSKRRAGEFVKKAFDLLAGLGENEYRKAIIETAQFIAERMA